MPIPIPNRGGPCRILNLLFRADPARASRQTRAIPCTSICGKLILNPLKPVLPPAQFETHPRLPRDEGGPVFAEPWQAQAFALAVKLSELGHFTWNEWAATLGNELNADAARDTIEEIKKLAAETGVDEVRFKTAQIYDYVNDPNQLIPENESYSRYRKNEKGGLTQNQ